MDTVSESRLSKVNSLLALRVRQMDGVYRAAHAGDSLLVLQGLRSYEEQAAIYAQGRTAPGAIVTNAPPGHSWHEFGLAVDVCPASLVATPNWSPESPLWPEIAQIGRDAGLVAGADYVHVPPDRPHFQLTGTFPVSPDNQARSVYMQGGLEAVWRQAGLLSFPVDVGGEISV